MPATSQSTSNPQLPRTATPAETSAIKAYLSQKPDIQQIIAAAKTSNNDASTSTPAEPRNEYERKRRAAVRQLITERESEVENLNNAGDA